MILSGVITWWKEQMRDLVPASLRSSLGRSWRPELIAATDSPDPSDIIDRSPLADRPRAALRQPTWGIFNRHFWGVFIRR